MIKGTLQAVRNFIFARQRAYLDTFRTEAGAKVLEDLAIFCRAHESTFSADPRLHAVNEGRREVWLRIQKHIQLDSETLWKTYERKVNE